MLVLPSSRFCGGGGEKQVPPLRNTFPLGRCCFGRNDRSGWYSRRALLDGLELLGELVYAADVEESGEVDVSGESFALFALHQNFYFQDTGDVGGEGLNQGRHR